MSLDGTGTHPLPTLAELVTAIDDTAREWANARADTDRASAELSRAMRRQIEAEQAYRAACRRYEQDRAQAT